MEAFTLALPKKEAVLNLHCDNPFLNEGGHGAMIDLMRRQGYNTTDGWSFHRAGLTVNLRPSGLSCKDLAFAYREADFGIFPTAGEGWGLPLLECLASGTPVIAGNWSGQSEFLGDDYPAELTLADSHLVVANDGIWFHGDRGSWHEPRLGELIEKIKWAHTNAVGFKSSENWAKIVEDRRIRFTWGRAAERLMEVLQTLGAIGKEKNHGNPRGAD